MGPLSRSFYERDAAQVARELLGTVLVHRSPEGTTSGRIVETEAYFGKGDPASRASRKRTKLNELMWWHGGLAFIYMVHARWMFNVTAEREGVPGAVLVRALEPLEGVELMKRRRGVVDKLLLTSGPGRLTQAMGITYEHHKLDLTTSRVLTILKGPSEKFDVARSHRIGVSADLKRQLRFFIRGNPFVSGGKL
ncbi:MAG: DNA-3-methyladenine glycosylase [Candidatus Hodarchaeaceae archaeon]|nr:DNA-3-methyladenine glycosylase [Candidatus Hodarchaeaceae archaeon]